MSEPVDDRTREREWALAAQRGDRRALESLLGALYEQVSRVCRRICAGEADADDATQEALISIVRALPHFDGRSAVRTWAYRVATNAALDELRRKGRRPVPTDDDSLGAEPSRGRQVDDDVSDRLDIESALALVPLEFRTAVVLRDLIGMEYAEIASTLGIPVGTVRSRIARGRRQLADLLHLGNQSGRAERPTGSTMTDHDDDSALDGTEGLDERALEALRVRLRDLEAPPAVRRDAHIAAALTVFDNEVAGTPGVGSGPGVVDLASRRRRVRSQQFLVAAAGVVLAGVAIVLGTRATSGSDEDRAATAAESSAQSSASAKSSDDSAIIGFGGPDGGNEASSPPAGSTETDAADQAAPEAGSDGFGADAAPLTTVPGTQIQAAVVAPIELGDVGSDAALRSAVDAARQAAAIGDVQPQTTLAPAPERDAATRSVLERCPTPPASFVFATATVAGSPVLVTATATPDLVFNVVDGTDCSIRPL